MSATTAHPSTVTPEMEKAQRALIDESTRIPVVLFYASAVFWLLVGSLFALLASFKMNAPTFLDQWGWLTFGRVRPAHLNAVAYGWAASAGIGTALWLMARLCRTIAACSTSPSICARAPGERLPIG